MKTIVICGVPESGKTFLAMNIALAFENPLWINTHDRYLKDYFFWSSCNENTDLIILDDLRVHERALDEIILPDNIIINEKMKKPLKIKKPQIIITTNYSVEKFLKCDASLLRRIKLINTWIDYETWNKPVFKNKIIEL